jgi:hypothetical protein
MNDANGWDWIWIVPMMLLWLVVLGGVVDAAVGLAIGHAHRPPAPPQ